MIRKLFALATVVAFGAGLAACSGGDKPASNISGAGATFPAPVYSMWAEGYKSAAGINFNYQAIGSGGGIKQIKAGTVDFGASDKPLQPAELDEAGLYQFPTVLGGVVPVINLPGISAGQIRLSGSLLADIFLGKITRWNDPAIAALNPGVSLPDTAITVVHRSDGSGTTFLFTTYLASVSDDWKDKVGASDAVQWPTGLGGKGNDGVAAFVKQTVGAIGYVEYAYTKKADAAYVLLQNRDGAFPTPNADAFAAAAAGADWANAPGNYILLLNQPGEGAWPITGATFILIHKEQKNAAKGTAVLQFFDWAYTNGDQNALDLDYVPMPGAVKAQIRQQWGQAITANGKAIYPAS